MVEYPVYLGPYLVRGREPVICLQPSEHYVSPGLLDWRPVGNIVLVSTLRPARLSLANWKPSWGSGDENLMWGESDEEMKLRNER